jgi:hypothetical protein
VDMEPVQIVPTWRNSRKGREGISKWLDWFFMENKLIEEIGKF